MSWECKKSLNRIFNTFKRLKTGVYKEDIDALNQLSEYIENKALKTSKDNLLYSKCISLLIRQNLAYYGSIKIAIKKINDELAFPLDFHIEQITKEFNHQEFLNYLKENNFDFNNCTIPEDKQKEFQDKLLTTWKKEDVEKSFYKTANDILQDLNNYT